MRGWRGFSLWFVVTVILTLGIAAAGCAGAGDPTATSTAGEAAAEGQDEPDNDGRGEGDGTGEQGAESLSWVPFGPTDLDYPEPSWPAYIALAKGDCATLEGHAANLADVGRAMVAVCAAAVDGEQEQWDEVAALSGVDPAPLEDPCLAQVVSELIDRALDWHERNPGQTPDVQFVQVAGKTECGAQSAARIGADSDFTEIPDTDATEEPDTSSTPDPDVSAATSGRSSDSIG